MTITTKQNQDLTLNFLEKRIFLFLDKIEEIDELIKDYQNSIEVTNANKARAGKEFTPVLDKQILLYKEVVEKLQSHTSLYQEEPKSKKQYENEIKKLFLQYAKKLAGQDIDEESWSIISGYIEQKFDERKNP